MKCTKCGNPVEAYRQPSDFCEDCSVADAYQLNESFNIRMVPKSWWALRRKSSYETEKRRQILYY